MSGCSSSQVNEDSKESCLKFIEYTLQETKISLQTFKSAFKRGYVSSLEGSIRKLFEGFECFSLLSTAAVEYPLRCQSTWSLGGLAANWCELLPG